MSRVWERLERMWELLDYAELALDWTLDLSYRAVKTLVKSIAGGLVAGAVYSMAAICLVGLTFAWVMGGLSLIWLFIEVMGQ